MNKIVLCISVCLISVSSTIAVFAQSSGGEFELSQSTVDAGGGVTSGGTFQLQGTIAQFDAITQPSSGGRFLLSGGFWAGESDTIFFSGFEGS